ncbi:MAG TPA: hypothetical protein QF468_05670 [Nitrospinota bacterium]|jgi:hypothetical protein|nr:hypothetical protein [Nitrospinota bacterium]
MFIGFQDIAINSRVNEGLVNKLKFKMKDKLVEAGRQTIYSQRPQVGSHLKNGAPRMGFSVEPGDFAYTKFVLIKAKQTFEEKTYSTSELIKGNEPVEPMVSVQPFTESKVATLYAESAPK